VSRIFFYSSQSPCPTVDTVDFIEFAFFNVLITFFIHHWKFKNYFGVRTIRRKTAVFKISSTWQLIFDPLVQVVKRSQCLYTCLCIYIHTYIGYFIYIYIHTYKHTFIYVYIYTQTHLFRKTKRRNFVGIFLRSAGYTKNGIWLTVKYIMYYIWKCKILFGF
jgi:hypothetical protein